VKPRVNLVEVLAWCGIPRQPEKGSFKMERCQCDWCQEECPVVFPVFNRYSLIPTGYDWVCSTCADLAFSERIGQVYRQSIPFRIPGRERPLASVAA